MAYKQENFELSTQTKNKNGKVTKTQLQFNNLNKLTPSKIKHKGSTITEAMKREIFKDIGTRKTIFDEFVDKVVERSLYLYKNNHCQTCSILLSQGKSTQLCPKCH